MGRGAWFVEIEPLETEREGLGRGDQLVLQIKRRRGSFGGIGRLMWIPEFLLSSARCGGRGEAGGKLSLEERVEQGTFIP